MKQENHCERKKKNEIDNVNEEKNIIRQTTRYDGIAGYKKLSGCRVV